MRIQPAVKLPNFSILYSYPYLHDTHCVVAEDVHDFDGHFVAAGGTFVIWRFEFEAAVFLGAEALPLVLEDEVAGPDFLFQAGGLVLDAHDFALVLEVEVDAPVVDPVRPLLGERFFGDDAVLVLAHFDDLAVFDHDFVLAVAQARRSVLDGVLGVEGREIGEGDGDGAAAVFLPSVCALDVGRHLNVVHVVEDNLVALDGALVEHFAGDVLEREVDALVLRFFLDIGEETHLELEGEDIHAGYALFAALEDDLLHEEAGDGQVDGTDRHEAPRLFALEALEVFDGFGLVRLQNEGDKVLFLLFELLLSLLLAEVHVDADVVSAFILAQIEHLEGAEVLARSFHFPLNADEALARGVDGELAEVTADPLAAELLGHREGGAGTREEVGHDVALVGAGFDDALEEGFGFLGGIIYPFLCHRICKINIGPYIFYLFAFGLI